MRFRWFATGYVALYVLVLFVAFLSQPLTVLSGVRVTIDPIAAEGTIVSAEPNGKVVYQYRAAGQTYSGYYFGARGGNPAAPQARTGNPVRLSYSRSAPADSCACEPRADFVTNGMPELGFLALILAGLVTTVGFGVEQLRRALLRRPA